MSKTNLQRIQLVVGVLAVALFATGCSVFGPPKGKLLVDTGLGLAIAHKSGWQLERTAPNKVEISNGTYILVIEKDAIPEKGQPLGFIFDGVADGFTESAEFDIADSKQYRVDNFITRDDIKAVKPDSPELYQGLPDGKIFNGIVFYGLKGDGTVITAGVQLNNGGRYHIRYTTVMKDGKHIHVTTNNDEHRQAMADLDEMVRTLELK